MPPTSNSNQQVLVIGAVVAIVIIAGSSYAAYQIGYGRGLINGAPSLTQEVTTTPAVRAVMGSVESVSGQEIVLGHFVRVPSLTDTPDPSATMTITVTQATVIERLTLNTSSATKSAQPTSPYSTQKITLADIKVGDVIAVSASEDISNVTAFTATKIDLQDPSQNPATLPEKP